MGNEDHIGSKLLSIEAAGSYLGVSRTTVYNLISLGQLVPIKILSSTRISVDELDRFIANAPRDLSMTKGGRRKP